MFYSIFNIRGYLKWISENIVPSTNFYACIHLYITIIWIIIYLYTSYNKRLVVE